MNVLECPTLLNSCCNIKIGTHIIQFRGSIGILHVLARYPVIFSLVGHITMVAEAPDHHIGDLGRMEEVRNGLNGIHLVGHREELNRNCLVELFLGFRKWCKLYY